MPRLIHVSADDAGYKRKGRGKGFEYFDPSGLRLKDQDELDRIHKMRIPPAWKNVWICTNPNGHLQATGIDARGRKQYLYHEEWNRRSHINKFDRMAGFARALPEIRKKVQLDLRKQGWPREKVISLMLSILDQNPIRIGNKSYEIENGTFGLSTLKRKHMKVNGNEIYFQFKAKGGIYRNAQIRGKRLTRLIVECSDLPGQEVFQYLDSEGKPHPIFSQDVNAYLQEISGNDFTAKDFRTWGGTVAAIDVYKDALSEIEASPKSNFTNCIVKRVAERLGNTLAVCKSYYIHPTILTLAERQQLDIDDLLSKASKKNASLESDLNSSELIALYLIENTSTDLGALLKESLQQRA